MRVGYIRERVALDVAEAPSRATESPIGPACAAAAPRFDDMLFPRIVKFAKRHLRSPNLVILTGTATSRSTSTRPAAERKPTQGCRLGLAGGADHQVRAVLLLVLLQRLGTDHGERSWRLRTPREFTQSCGHYIIDTVVVGDAKPQYIASQCRSPQCNSLLRISLIRPENDGSIRVVQRLGGVREGTVVLRGST